MGLAGIEPATSALSVLRSNRLSYSPRRPGWRTFEATPRLLAAPPRERGLRLIRWPASVATNARERVGPGPVDGQVRAVRPEPLRVLGGQRRPVGDRPRWDTGRRRWRGRRCSGPARAGRRARSRRPPGTRPPRIAIMLSKSVSVIGPLVPSADDDVRAELTARLHASAGSISPSDHCRLTEAFTLMPGIDRLRAGPGSRASPSRRWP